jgi:lipoprotein-anchoring transpeptidase ErfK/SrfK
MAPAKPTFSPLILPVGAHSDTLDSYGGGPGTVAFHGWPSKSVFGQAVTHGCVRVPADALKRLSKIPLGTPVFITN